MKKLFLALVMVVFVAVNANAVTPEEKQASADRVAKLTVAAPKACGIAEFDKISADSKVVAEATASISTATATITANTTPEELSAIGKQIKEATTKLGEVTKMFGDVGNALKQLKNPMKIKPATNQITYSKDVVTNAGEELIYQAKLIASMAKKK